MIQRFVGAIVGSARQYARRQGAGTPPSFLTAPAIIGQPVVGTPVSFTSGSVAGVPTPTTTQQWLLDGANIVGATNLTYTPQAADAGKQLSVRQTAQNGNNPAANSTSASVIVATVPAVTSNPVILGTPTEGTPVAYTSGSYSGTPAPTVSARQWLRNGSNIAGATNATYTPVAADVGTATLSIRETVSNVAGSVSATSAARDVAPSGTNAALEADWTRRSTAAGVTAFTDFRSASDFVSAATNGGHIFANGMDPALLALVTKDTTDGLTGNCCLRIDTPASMGANSAAYMMSLNSTWTTNAQGMGTQEFWIQKRVKFPSSRFVLSNCGGAQRGWKWFNLAQYSPTATSSQSFSNVLAEIVGQDTDQRGMPQAYHRGEAVTGNGDFSSFPPFNGFAGGQITLQTAVDHGLDAAAVGDRYCHYPNGTPGCWFWPADEWVTVMIRVKQVVQNGSTGNEFDMWVARRGDTVWTQLFKDRNVSLGSNNSSGGGHTGGYNGLHLLTYETNRINSTVDTHHKYDQIIVSTQPIALPFEPRTGSALATLVNGMSPGTWAELTGITGQNTALQMAGNSGSIMHFGNSMPWNPKTHCIEILASDHMGSVPSMRHVRYIESSNSFVIAQAEPAVPEIGHAYDHTDVNPHTGDVYYRQYNATAVHRKRNGASTFGFVSNFDNLGFGQSAIGTCWWSGEFNGGSGAKTEGCFVIFNSGYGNIFTGVGAASDGQIVAWDPVTRTWIFNATGMAPFYAAGGPDMYHSIIEYSARKNVAVFGGGNDASRKLWRLNKDGTSTPMPDVPAGKGIGMQRGIITCDPITGNFILMSAHNDAPPPAIPEMWELNPDGAGTWTQLTGSRVPPAGAGNPSGSNLADGVICVSLPEHGAIAYIKQTGSTGGRMFVYKHA